MRLLSAGPAVSTVVLLFTACGLVGGGGWAVGRRAEAASGTPSPAAAPVAVQPPAAHHAHHARHAPQAAESAAGHKHHGHECEKDVCRCDSRCAPRRSGPCGGSLRSCAGGGDEGGLGPGPGRPFLLTARVLPVPALDCFDPPDVHFVPTTRALEPFSPPPRASAV